MSPNIPTVRNIPTTPTAPTRPAMPSATRTPSEVARVEIRKAALRAAVTISREPGYPEAEVHVLQRAAYYEAWITTGVVRPFEEGPEQ